MNNPFGTYIILGEIIPADFMGIETYDFRPSASDGNTTNADTIFFLSGSSWNEYYYKGGVNDGVIEVATASAKAGTEGSNNGIAAADVEFVSGTVSALASCDATGGTAGVDHNASEYTKVSLAGGGGPGPASADDWNGFSVTFSEISGRSVSDTYDTGNSAQYELDVNGSDVTAGGGIMVYSNLNGTHEVVDSATGYVIVKVKRDVNFESGKGDKKWALGSAGTGYNTTAKVYFIGGGGSGGKGDAAVSGGAVTSITITAPGAGYTEAPQVVITGGGWRLIGGADAPEDNQILSSDEGMILVRKHPTGILTYIEAINPVK
jgi:hypothetical protein